MHAGAQMTMQRSISRAHGAAISFALVAGVVGAMLAAPGTEAQNQRPDCGNFLSQQDAQIALEADPSDPFGLDADHNGKACETPSTAFGTPPLVNCADLQGHDAIANALYQLSLAEYGTDRYGLAGCAAQSANGAAPSTASAPATTGAPPANAAPSTGAPPSSAAPSMAVTPAAGPAVVAIAAPLGGSGESLGAALESRFAAMEASFAAFSGESMSGPGNLPASGAGLVVSSGALPSPPATVPIAASNTTTATTPTTTAAGGHGHHHHHKRHHHKHKGHGHNKNHKHHKH
jgi:hypothetical protein